MKKETKKWAERELGSAELGDKRLTKRLVEVAESFSDSPDASIPKATINWNNAKGAYRFFDNPKVTGEKILKAHGESSSKRVAEDAKSIVILAVQDTSEVNYSSHLSCALGHGGQVDTNVLFLHPTLICTEEGVPLGLIQQQIWKRTELAGELRREKPIEEKESYKWLKSFKASAEFQQHHAEKHVINICDREGDIYDLFYLAKQAKEKGKIDLLVRSSSNRRIKEGQNLHALLENQVPQGCYQLELARNGKRTAKKIKMAVRFCEVSICPPKYSSHAKEVEGLKVWAVEAIEENPTAAIPTCWKLITTYPVSTLDEAKKVIDWYASRWIIEEYFKVLKSGCKIEDRQLQTFDRLDACLALDAIIAWRILFLLYAGRQMPELPASILFEESECKALYSYTHQTPNPPPKPLTLQDMTSYLAKLGGFLGRKGDGLPGAIVLWRGAWRLPDISATWKIFNP